MTDALASALDPRSIAVVGASDNPDKIGGRCLQYIQRFGYKGEVYPINPGRPTVQGLRSFPSLSDAPGVPELAVITVAGDLAVQAVAECAALGTKVAVVITAGFGETGETGRRQEAAMVASARASGTRIVGPNTQGLANFGTGAIANFSTMFIEVEPVDGPIAIVSQSGGMAAVPFGLLRERGLGVRHCHSIGNQCDVTVSELGIAVANDPAVALLLLYIEGIPDPERLAELGAVARRRELPVLVLKSGRTAAGQIASRSHTGSLATEDRVVEAFLDHHGLMRVADPGGLVSAAELYLKGWRPRGRRLAVISNSGTSCVLSADAATQSGLTIEPFRPDTQRALKAVLPEFATATNPVDITAALLTNSGLFGAILPIIAGDPGADAFLISVPVAGRGYDFDRFATDAARFAAATGKPIVIVTPQPKVARRFKEDGLPVYTLESEAIAALAQFLTHRELMERVREPQAEAGSEPTAARRPPASTVTLNEAESLDLVSRHGVRVVEHVLCPSADDAVAAWERLSGPVAVKACTREVTHKSDLGLVRLGLDGAEGVREAAEAVLLAADRAGVRIDGVLVARMAPDIAREMIVGAHRDPTFGPVVIVGDGGKYVEALPDSSVLLPDASKDDVRRALSRLRVAPILRGVRGEPPMDVDALGETVSAVASLMSDPARRIVSIDLNPVALGREGEGCLALDGVVLEEREDP
jgi:acyl-CoA synthetase (NDP forming)